MEDAALLLQAMVGYDRLDIASVEHGREDYLAALQQPVKSLKLGVPRAPFFDHLDPEIAVAVEAAIATLRKIAGSAKDATLPGTKGTGSTGGEVYAYHEEFYTKGPNLYQIPTRRSLQNGKEAKAAEYIRAKWKLDLLRRTIDDAFTSQDVDLMVLPTRRRSPREVNASIARETTEKPRNPELENTGEFNAYGIPAVSVPCGFTKAGLPIGLMIVGPRFSEGRVLALAHAYEQATEWHNRRPPLQPDTPVPPLKESDA